MKINDSYRSRTVCAAVIGSMTMALKAQRTLAKRSVRANVRKITPGYDSKGCIYGVEFDYNALETVRAILNDTEFTVVEYIC